MSHWTSAKRIYELRKIQAACITYLCVKHDGWHIQNFRILNGQIIGVVPIGSLRFALAYNITLHSEYGEGRFIYSQMQEALTALYDVPFLSRLDTPRDNNWIEHVHVEGTDVNRNRIIKGI